jgi:hypothetical protein
MRRPDLVIGLTYVLQAINDRPNTAHVECVYEEQHDGVLTLADGATYHGGRGTLRFRVTDAGTTRIVLLGNGTDVIETAQTRIERERQEAEHAARVIAARARALQFLAELGITEVYTPGDRRSDWSGTRIVSLLEASENADDLTVNGLSIGQLRAIVGRTP